MVEHISKNNPVNRSVTTHCLVLYHSIPSSQIHLTLWSKSIKTPQRGGDDTSGYCPLLHPEVCLYLLSPFDSNKQTTHQNKTGIDKAKQFHIKSKPRHQHIPPDKGYLASVFVHWQWPAVGRCDAVPVAVNALHQPVVPGCPTGIQHRVLEWATPGEWSQQQALTYTSQLCLWIMS